MKKLISIFLILCFIFGVFTACEKAESATDGTAETEKTATPTEASTEVPTEEAVLGRPRRDPTEKPSPLPPRNPPSRPHPSLC